MFSVPNFSYRADIPHAVLITFYGVDALSGGNAVIHFPQFVVSGRPPIVAATVDESLDREVAVSGVLAADPETMCGEPKTTCFELSTAEVIFRTAEGAEAWSAAFHAARFPFGGP